MRTMNRRMRFASPKEDTGDITLDALQEQLNELTIDDVEDDSNEVASVIQEADNVLKEIEGGSDVTKEDVAAIQQAIAEKESSQGDQVLADADAVLKACDKIEKANAELPDEKEIVSEEDAVLADCDKVEAAITAAERKASTVKPGIEDRIGDQSHGGDPSVSALPKTKIDCDTDKKVFGKHTDCEYVASITKKLDRVAAALEKRGMNRMAFRIDQLSDKLEASVRK